MIPMTREIQFNALDMNCAKRRLPNLSAQPRALDAAE
jgi:hypothetical protein